MAVTNKGPTNDSVQLTLDSQGYHLTEIHYCQFSANVTAATRSQTLLDMITAVGVSRLDDHPVITSIECKKIAPKISSLRGGEVMLTYDPITRRNTPAQGDPLIEVGASLVTVETNVDVAGDPITVEYTYPDADPWDEETRGKFFKTDVAVQFGQPQNTLRFTQTESSNPESIAQDYVGQVNQYVWRGKPKWTWRCNSIVGRSDDGGDNYTVTYEFEYRTDGWDPLVYYIDKFTGRPPADLIPGTGKKYVAVYDHIDFNNLSIN